jgi:hypothetical protein
MKKLWASSIGKAIIIAGCLLGGYEANEHWHLVGNSNAGPASSWFSPSPAPAGTTAEFTVKNVYVTPNGRVLIGSAEDYLDPQNQTVVVPASLARSKGIDAGIVGKTVKASGNKSTYKGRPQLVAVSLEVK